MTEKTEQKLFNKAKKPLRNKSAIRIPISLHFYAVEIVVIILVVFIINIYIQSIVKNYIANECNSRLDIAVNSTQNFADAFTSQITASDERTEENIRAYLTNTIVTSADLSNQASIALYTFDENTGKHLVLWPTAYYSTSYANNANNVITQVIEEEGYKTLNKTQTLDIDGNIIYYRTLKFEILTTVVEGDVELDADGNPINPTPAATTTTTPSATNINGKNIDLDNYYLCIYINSRSYYSFMASMTLALVQAAMLAIVIAGLLSIMMTYPLIFSTQKLSKFAKRIAKGDLRPVRGHIVSKELSELGDVMNQMAYKLGESDIEQKTFFQNASHELRTPLMSIQGYAEGLKYGVFESEEDRDNAINVIIDETGRLSSLVENLLSISKMDMSRSGNYEVKKQNIDISKLYDTIIDRVRGNFIHNDKSIINDFNAKNVYVYVYGNENDLLRCIENIFSNCLRYCKTAVTFKCRTDKSGNNVIFEISDDGPGIAPEVQEHLFERFSKGADGKHGIGLALALSIAEEHEGTVNAYNKKDGGACFEVILPVIKQKEQLTKINNDSTT